MSIETHKNQICNVAGCTKECRSDTVLRHLYTHRTDANKIMPSARLAWVREQRKPVLVAQKGSDYSAVCLNCIRGIKHTNYKIEISNWIREHNHSPCLLSWDTHKDLFEPAEGTGALLPPDPAENATINHVGDEDSYSETRSEYYHDAGAEELVDQYREIDDLVQRAIKIKTRIEWRDVARVCTSYTVRATDKERRECKCVLHGKNETYNQVSQLLEKYMTEREELGIKYPSIKAEYYRRVLLSGGYDWKPLPKITDEFLRAHDVA
jgi:hypothetical protein